MKNKISNFTRRFGTLTSLFIFAMPVFLIMFLGGMMARGQVKGEFTTYQAIQEYANLNALKAVPQNQIVMLRGRIVDGLSPAYANGLIVFQERPLNGRELRFQEEFPFVFPPITLALADGTVRVEAAEGRVIAHESQRVEDKARDREYTGFRKGDEVTVQGKWQASANGQAQLKEATGITSQSRASIMAEGQYAFDRLDTICTVLGILSLVPLVLLVVQLVRMRLQSRSQAKPLDPVNV